MHEWIERVAVCGTSFRRVGLGRLGELVLPTDGEALTRLRAGLEAEELVYLATCNRVECYVVEPGRADAARLLARAEALLGARPGELFARQGREAVAHLFAVAGGLDSLVLGETEVAGQLRRAHARSQAAGRGGPVLERLIERAAACSRRVKSEAAFGPTPTSAADLAAQKLRKYFGERGPGVAVFVGAGEMTEKVARALASRPGERVFVNRTKARAEELARRHGGEARSLAEWLAAPPARLDLLFTATAAGTTVVPVTALEPALAARTAADGPLVVCDLGVPRDVDPAIDARPGALVVDMQAIEALAQRGQAAIAPQLERARRIVDDEVASLARQARFEHLAATSARAMLAGPLAHLRPEDGQLVQRFVTGLAARMARQPLAP